MGGFKTKKEATTIAKEIERKLALEKMQRKLLKAGYVHQTFHQEFEKWMNKTKMNLNPKTIQSYVNTKNKIEKYFDDTLLKDITLEMYEDFLASFSYLNKATNHKMHKHIRQFVKSAFERQLVFLNFTTDAAIVGEKSKETKKYLNADEYDRFIRFVYNAQIDLQYKLMVLLAILTGVRFGELCAICWDDIDFEKGQLYVHRQWDYVNGSGFTGLKDPDGYKYEGDIKERYLPLSNQLIELLKEYKTSSEYVKNDDSRLFYKPNCKAKVLSNTAFNNKLDMLLYELKIPRLTCHKLRHSYATNLVKLKISKEAIQYLLGHESYETTEKYYVHYVHLDELLFKYEFIKLNSINY